MAEYCPNCFEKLDALHLCSDLDSGESSRNPGSNIWSQHQSLANFVILAPLAGLILDFVVPLPSSLVHSFVLSLIGSAAASMVWVSLNYDGQKSFRFFFFNLRHFIYTPNVLKIFGGNGNKKVLFNWLLIVLFSTALQIVLFTPGNSAHLEGRVSAKIDDASGANLKVDCPNTKLFLYNERIECRVKTGIFGITVPARTNLSPILGEYQIKVSIL